ncbi:MAG: alpha-L-arabinofuranosidase C-terminal domain-containing protein [Janthinobacterium lividum]
MKNFSAFYCIKNSICSVIIFALLTASVFAQSRATITLQLDKPGVNVSPKLYGLMTEEINYSYDGGLYAELIRNRIFKDNFRQPEHWSLIQEGEGKGTITLDRQQPVNNALNVSLKLNVENVGKRVAIANDGFWGIPIKPGTIYRGSFYAKTSNNQENSLSIAIESIDGKTTYALAQVSGLNNQWKRYTFTLNTRKDLQPTANTRFVIGTKDTGNYWFNLVSLFPPTYNNRPNGNRSDIMQLLGDMKPAFLRLPGGNYLEGQMFSTRFDWKKTLGNIDQRPGHMGTWSYRSSDGMGLLEYLEWCEDLKMEPVLALFAGYTLNKDYLEAGPLLKPFVDDALDEIEYVTGDTNTKWGAKRAQDGHPKPFKITYVEIGNEDGFDVSGSYEGRYNQFSDAIRAKYPQLQLISTVGGKDPLGGRFKTPARTPEALDEHYYRTASEMEEDANHYDNYDRKGPKIFVGEWATREGDPTTNMNAALGDAAWMTGMERNSDLVVMSCYAPLFVNVNPGGMQWKSDLIGYNSLTSYGSPSYYVQKIFNTYLGDKVVPISAENIPTQLTKLTKRDSTGGTKQKTIPAMFYVATRSSNDGRVYLKIVNATSQAQPVNINLKGVAKVASAGSKVVIKADKPEDTNTITEPKKIVPVISTIKGLGTSFNQTFPAYSITVLQIETK